MAGTRKDDLWGCIDMRQENTTVANERLLASLPPVAPAKPPQDTSAIYTFLGLATLPRLSKGNPRLHELPRELVTHIARFAHRPEYRYCWLGTGNTGQKNSEARSVDVTDFHDVVLCMPPMRNGVHYVELDFRSAWEGTKICFEGTGQFFWIELTARKRKPTEPRTEDSIFEEEVTTISFKSYDYSTRDLEVPALGVDCWVWCNLSREDPVRLALLVDMVRGCVTFRLNGTNGPCVRFPTLGDATAGHPGRDAQGKALPWTRGDHWRRGVQIVVRNFPDRQRLINEADCWTPRCVVECSRPRRADTARELSIREASANPMTVEEHIRAGSLVEVPGTGWQETAGAADY